MSGHTNEWTLLHMSICLGTQMGECCYECGHKNEQCRVGFSPDCLQSQAGNHSVNQCLKVCRGLGNMKQFQAHIWPYICTVVHCDLRLHLFVARQGKHCILHKVRHMPCNKYTMHAAVAIGQWSTQNWHTLGQWSTQNGHTLGQWSTQNGHTLGQWSTQNEHILGQLRTQNRHTLGQWSTQNRHTLKQWSTQNGHTLGQWSTQNGHTLGQWSTQNGHTLVQWSTQNGHTLGQWSTHITERWTRYGNGSAKNRTHTIVYLCFWPSVLALSRRNRLKLGTALYAILA